MARACVNVGISARTSLNTCPLPRKAMTSCDGRTAVVSSIAPDCRKLLITSELIDRLPAVLWALEVPAIGHRRGASVGPSGAGDGNVRSEGEVVM